jgi:hypothetical protein
VGRQIVLPLALNPWLSTVAMMALAFTLALCSTSDAFIAATFTTFPFGAKLAFLTLGAMIDIAISAIPAITSPPIRGTTPLCNERRFGLSTAIRNASPDLNNPTSNAQVRRAAIAA